MESLAALADLEARLDWTLDTSERQMAAAALLEASDYAREYGRADWVDAASAPRLVANLVLSACVRYMRNPEGYAVSRSGDETVEWGRAAQGGGVAFSRSEIRLLRSLGGRVQFGSIEVTAWNSRPAPATGYVPVAGGERPFPLYASDRNPW
jgi:hypothetical protein